MLCMVVLKKKERKATKAVIASKHIKSIILTLPSRSKKWATIGRDLQTKGFLSSVGKLGKRYNCISYHRVVLNTIQPSHGRT